ncbi:aldehyde dehydrogenase family protein [Alteromonadaceae bacterium M269]|nr:aldehyde dehydrogenase family protein [Alteromonadaceae bacterium M269]
MANTRDVLSPFNQEKLGEVPVSNAEQVENALSSAYALFRKKSGWLPLHRRVEILEKTAEIISSRRDELALASAKEGGKPLMDSIVEINRAIDGVRLAIEHIRADAGNVIPMGGTASSHNRAAFTQKEPIGVVVAVSAFNHPFNLIVHQVGAAVAAGCPVLVKPSSDTPMSCLSFVKILHEAGLPEDWCQFVVPADRSLSEKMVVDERVSFFSFIGSAQVGWSLRSKLSPGTRCALEHGGVAPVVVAADADIPQAVSSLCKGGFYHAGQVCVSVQRIYVHSSIIDELGAQLAEQAKQLVVGDPASAETQVGPIISTSEFNRVAEWVEEAKSMGTTVLCGGERLDNNCYAPTVLVNPPADAKVSTSEVFGPVVCLYAFDELDEAFEAANSLDVAFQAAVFTKDIETAMTAYRQLDASAVMLNDHTAFRVDGMPFAGLKEAGLGVGGLPHTIEDMQIEKMLVIHSAALSS